MAEIVEKRNKGKSLIATPNDYTVLDLETTGLSSQFNHIIEIGCIKIRDRHEIARFQSLVKPAEPIPYVIECMTGIHNDMIAAAPIFQDLANELWDFLKDEIIIGHNVNFDINFLYDNFKRSLNSDFTNDFVDTLRLAHMLLPDLKEQGYNGYGLSNLCDYFGISITPEKKYSSKIDEIVDKLVMSGFPQLNTHRALNDSLLANEVFQHLKKLVAENNVDLTKLKHQQSTSRKLKNLQNDGKNLDESHIFFGKCCVFTGKLEKFTRADAAQIVVNIGGYCEDRITQRTNFLIVGDMDYKKGLEGYESNKLKKAKQLIAAHQNLQIIPESAFYDLVADSY